jgi:PAS domain S-box-containing protein
MVSGSYSFIDIAVLDQVRGRLAAGDALAILDIELERIVWANGPGAALFGHSDVETVMGEKSGLSPIARRQIAAAPGFPRMRRETAVTVRLGARPAGLMISAVTLPDGEPAILLALPRAHAGAREADEMAREAVSGFTNADTFAALIDEKGRIEAASEGFEEMGIAQPVLAELVEEVRDEEDRLVKRLISAAGTRLAAGIARLTDDPARHLLLVIEAGEEEADGEPVADVVEIGEAEAGAVSESAAADEVSADVDSGPVMTAANDSGRAEAPDPEGSPHAEQAEETPAAEVDATASRGEEPGQAAKADEASNRSAAVRFVWRTDAEGRFTTISEEFATAVGIDPDEVAGRTFREVADRFGIEAGEEVAELLERRDTWSGRTVYWPLAETGLQVPVDLAALPIYDRVRNFEGFRGFGVARMGDAATASEHRYKAGATRAEQAETGDAEKAASPKGEVPAISVAAGPERRHSDKVIRLAEHRAANGDNAPATGDEGLSASERFAFRQIGERLRRESGVGETEAEAAPVEPPETHISNGDDSTSTPEEAAAEDRPQAEPPAPQEAPEPEPAAPVAAIGLDDLRPAPELERRGHLPSAFPASQVAAADPATIGALLAGLPFPILVHTGDTLHFANRAFLNLTGHETLEAIAAAGGIGGLFVDEVDPAQTTGALRLARPDGEEIDVCAHLQSIAWNGGKALLLALKPITDEPAPAGQAGDNALQARLDEMRAIVDTATDGVVLLDMEGNIRSISRPAEALFGLDSEQIEGKPFTALFAMESQRAASDYLAGLADNGVASVLNDGREVIGREAQGRFIPLFMTMGRLPGDGGYCAVLRDITNWKRAEEDLTQARAQAERASSQKTEFLARVSHEVRTPLNAIIGFSELMLDEKFGPVGNERYRDYLRDINRSGNHVLDLVNDLLDISKIEAGEQEMSYEAVSLNDALAETVAMMQPQANRERVIIRSSFASRLPEVVADLRSVRQIALNLLSNAVRATPAGGQVIVSTAYERSGDIVVRVRDTGIGMTLAEIEQALKPFKQINAIKRARGEGTGLGLPLTKAMVEANRARFAISSTPGQGTMVEIVFPSTRVLAD